MRPAHKLEVIEEGTCQDMKRKQSTEGHSQTGDGRGRDKLGQGKKAAEEGILTNWRPWREGKIKTW